MSKLDRAIEEALGAEDRQLFDQHKEQGLFGQIGGLFSGRLGWWNALTAVIQFAAFGVALYAGRKVLTLDDPAALIRWSGLVGLAFISMSVIKLIHWNEMQANRVIREVKRLAIVARAGRDDA